MSECLKDAPIGVFDSGFGGLTVVREIMRQIPNEKIVYFGDTARVPYGSKSKETVTRFSRQITHFLQTQNVKTIVVACNTASAYALDELEKEIDIPMIGVVKPGAKVAAETTRNGKVGVIATSATIGSEIYTTYIKDLKPEISTSIEFGTEWKFFNNRFGIDFTWYRTDTKNQLLRVANPAGSLYAFRYITMQVKFVTLVSN